MQVTILSSVKSQAVSKAGKPYTYLELAYKDETGRVSGRKVMPFGESKPVFETLSVAQGGEIFHITSVKNDAGYWDWTKANKDTSVPGVTTPVSDSNIKPMPLQVSKVLGSNYETPEERAKKQVYIVRQSSISAALNFHGGKAKTVEEVTNTAKKFEDYVFSTGEVDKPVTVQNILEDDIPL